MASRKTVGDARRKVLNNGEPRGIAASSSTPVFVSSFLVAAIVRESLNFSASSDTFCSVYASCVR